MATLARLRGPFCELAEKRFVAIVWPDHASNAVTEHHAQRRYDQAFRIRWPCLAISVDLETRSWSVL